MKIISIVNQKGGVAKTTTALNLAYALKEKYSVLLIDTDKQCNLTHNMNVGEYKTSFFDLLLKEDYQIINKEKNLDFIPSSLDLMHIEKNLADKYLKELIFKEAAKQWKDKYDYVIIDCPPSIDIVVTNVLSASSHVVMPLRPSEFAYEGVYQMMEYIQTIRSQINNDLKILGFLFTMYDSKLNITKNILKKFENDNIANYILNSKIRINTEIGKSQEAKQDIFTFNPKCNAAEDYKEFAVEVVGKAI